MTWYPSILRPSLSIRKYIRWKINCNWWLIQACRACVCVCVCVCEWSEPHKDNVLISFVCSPSLPTLLLCVSRCSRMQGVLPARGVQPLLALLLLQSVGCGESSLKCMHLLTYSAYSTSPETIMFTRKNHRQTAIIFFFYQSESWSDSIF